MKVILLGIDGMTLDVLEPYLKADLLPNFQKVINNGSHGILRSTIPPITGPGWTSMATGKNPGKHGIFEFSRRKGYKKELVTKNTSVDAEPFWNILSRNGKKMIIANVPFTYPPDDINGIMFSGLMTPGTDTEFASPRNIKDEILRLIPDYQINVNKKATLYSDDKNELLNEVIKITKDTTTLMNHFMSKYPWELSFITYVGIDRLQHFWWDEVMSLDPKCVEVYKLMDDALGDILAKMDDDTVLLIASDHGFSAAEKTFYINAFLSRAGLLKFRRKKNAKKNSDKIKISEKFINTLLRQAGRLRIKERLPRPVVDYIVSILPTPFITEHNIDWENTKVFSMAPYGIISVNLKGREPKGTVKKKDAHALIEKLKKELMAEKDDETGENIIEAVFEGDQIYSPNSYDDAPDILILMNKGYAIDLRLGKNVLEKNTSRRRKISGDHNIDGMFAVYGGMIEKKRFNAAIYDIMPTILYLMGSAIPDDVDGSVLTEAINNEFIDNNKIIYEKARSFKHSEENVLSEEDTKKVEEALKNLGYME